MLRRKFLKLGLAVTSQLAVLAAIPTKVFARNKQAFDNTSIENSINDLYRKSAQESGKIKLKVPEIAENGAVVPVNVKTDLANVKSMAVYAKENPRPLVAYFELSKHSVANVSTRMKMGKTSLVTAVVETSDGVYETSKEVKVTIGGCGG